MPKGLLDFARRLHAKFPKRSLRERFSDWTDERIRGFYIMQLMLWLALNHPLEHDKYLNLLEQRGKK